MSDIVEERRKTLSREEYEEKEIQRIRALGLDFDKTIPNSRDQYFKARRDGYVTYSTIFLTKAP